MVGTRPEETNESPRDVALSNTNDVSVGVVERTKYQDGLEERCQHQASGYSITRSLNVGQVNFGGDEAIRLIRQLVGSNFRLAGGRKQTLETRL
jgi:hypothetical protein